MKKINLIVHIPKTAGTSFRYALQENALVRMLYDYGEKSPESVPALTGANPMSLTPDSQVFDADKFNFICGHVDYARYAHFVSQDSVVSIVRNPVERLVSEYQHLKRDYGYAHSFAEFSSDSPQQNKQSRMLGGVDQESGALIGLTSHYKYFVEVFSRRFGLPLKPISANQAPVPDVDCRFGFSPDEIKSAYLCNKQDMDFFFEKAGNFFEVIQAAGYNTTPAKDANWSCRIVERRQLIGWVSCSATDCYFVQIDVNGERRAIIPLGQNRDDVHAMGLSESPVCGFSYPLALLGAGKGDRITVGVFGAPEFTRTLDIDWER